MNGGLLLTVEPHQMWCVFGHRVKELEAAAPVVDSKIHDAVPAANDPPLRKQSSDLAVLRTTNVSDYFKCRRTPQLPLFPELVTHTVYSVCQFCLVTDWQL